MPTSPTQDIDRMLARLDRFDDLPAARALRSRARELLRARPGDTVVDVGCGAGRASGELAADGVSVVGVDRNEHMLAVARERHPGVDFRRADAYELPLGDGRVWGYRAEKVYHSITDTARALAEAHRVLAPGGRVVLLGQDWDAYMVDADDAGLARAIVRSYADGMSDPRAPRRQRGLLLAAGFENVEVEGEVLVFTDDGVLPMLTGMAEAARDAGAITAEQAGEWSREQRLRAREGRLFVAIPFLTVSADRP